MAFTVLRTSAARNLSLLPRNLLNTTTTQFLRCQSSSSSVSQDELKHFSLLASSWWDPLGPSRILHLMNPLRHEFLTSCLSESQPPAGTPKATDTTSETDTSMSCSEAGLRYLDIGCGGGIFAESLARTISLDASASSTTPTNASSILAIDPSPTMIKIALSHARTDPVLYSHLQSGRFRYENTTLEAFTSYPASYSTQEQPHTQPLLPETKFDVVTLFEVLEHVDPSTSSPRHFLRQCLRLLRPGGWLIGSTIARTWPSFLVNQVVAEAPWPVGVVPWGTHEWNKFVNMEELKEWAEQELLRPDTEFGTGNGDMRWKCAGTMYIPGFGWKMVPGAEQWGNYFWGVQKTGTGSSCRISPL